MAYLGQPHKQFSDDTVPESKGACLIDGKGGKGVKNDWLFKDTLGLAKDRILAAHVAEQKAAGGGEVDANSVLLEEQAGLTRKEQVRKAFEAEQAEERAKAALEEAKAKRLERSATSNATSLEQFKKKRPSGGTAGGNVGGSRGGR